MELFLSTPVEGLEKWPLGTGGHCLGVQKLEFGKGVLSLTAGDSGWAWPPSPRSGLPHPPPANLWPCRAEGERREGEIEGRKCFSSSIGNNNTGGPGSAWGLETVPPAGSASNIPQVEGRKMLGAESRESTRGALQPSGALPFQSFLLVSLSRGTKGQRGAAICLKLHGLLRASTQLLATVSSAARLGVHTPKFLPQPYP